jgi:hypothetical protein
VETFQLSALASEVAGKLADRPDDDGAVLRTVLIICEVDTPQDTAFVYACSDDRPWVMEAFAAEFADWTARMRQRLEDAAADGDA